MKQVARKTRPPEVLVPLILAKLEADTGSVVEIGVLLLEAQAQLPYGRWLPWLSDNFALSADSAERFMRAARWADAHPKFRSLRNLSRELLYELSAKTVRFPAPVVEQILKEAEGKRIGRTRAAELAWQYREAHREADAEKRRKATEAELAKRQKAAEAEERQATDEAEAILDGPGPKLPPAPPPEPANSALPVFDAATGQLLTVYTKPASKFTDSARAAEQLEALAEFLKHVAAELRKRRAPPETDRRDQHTVVNGMEPQAAMQDGLAIPPVLDRRSAL